GGSIDEGELVAKEQHLSQFFAWREGRTGWIRPSKIGGRVETRFLTWPPGGNERKGNLPAERVERVAGLRVGDEVDELTLCHADLRDGRSDFTVADAGLEEYPIPGRDDQTPNTVGLGVLCFRWQLMPGQTFNGQHPVAGGDSPATCRPRASRRFHIARRPSDPDRSPPEPMLPSGKRRPGSGLRCSGRAPG